VLKEVIPKDKNVFAIYISKCAEMDGLLNSSFVL